MDLQTQSQIVKWTLMGQITVVAISLVVLGIYALHYDGTAATGIIQTLQEVIATSGLVTGVVAGIHVFKSSAPPPPQPAPAASPDPNAAGGQSA